MLNILTGGQSVDGQQTVRRLVSCQMATAAMLASPVLLPPPGSPRAATVLAAAARHRATAATAAPSRHHHTTPRHRGRKRRRGAAGEGDQEEKGKGGGEGDEEEKGGWCWRKGIHRGMRLAQGVGAWIDDVDAALDPHLVSPVDRPLSKRGPSAVQEVRTSENLIQRDRMCERLGTWTVHKKVADGPSANVLKS